MIIERLRGERLQTYRPVYHYEGRTEAADYTISLFPSEVVRREASYSGGKIKVRLVKEEISDV